jgi:type IV secretory pathway TraG/TraD family ATPase VirD4
VQNNSYEGFETFTNAFKMVFKMHLCILIAIFTLQAFTVLALIDFRSPEARLVISWHKANILAKLPLKLKTNVIIDNETHTGYAKDIAHHQELKLYVQDKQRRYCNIFLLSCLIYILYPIIIIYFRHRSKDQAIKKYIRGAKLTSPQKLTKQFKKRKEVTDLPLGLIKMPKKLENRQSVLIGKPGSGKTQALRPILRRLIERGEKGICYDNKGDYISEFYNPETDLLFNPLDARSLGWNLFNELVSYPDIDAVAASLVPPSKANTDPFWNDAARGVFSGILHYLYQKNRMNNAELWKMLTADASEIAIRLNKTKGGEAGYRYITQNAENSRQAESVLAVLMQYSKCFEYMVANDGDFTINHWLEKGRGFIYITNYDVIEETLRPVLSLFVDLVCRKLLSMPDSDTRRIYLMLDEFGSLQRLPTLINLLTKGRSKGACTFLGIQDDGQTEKIYTPPLRKSIDNACGNRLTFSLSGETAGLESRFNIGECEFLETNRSMSMGPHSMRDGISLQKNKKRGPLFLPSDIANLKDLTAIVRLKNYDFVLSEWVWEQPQQIHEPFILRKDLLLKNIVKELSTLKKEVENAVNQMPMFNMEPIKA